MRSILLVLFTLLNAHAGDYRELDHRVGKLHLYRAAPEEISLHWKEGTDAPLRTFRKIGKSLIEKEITPIFMMNAGIFEPGGIPSGLHVEKGVEHLKINLNDAPGNFFLKPNGAFWIDTEGKAHITNSENYAKTVTETPRLALQSGPLLLDNDAVHPKFNIGSESTLHRNGVGILEDGRVLFVVTDFEDGTRVNLYTFAMLFREFGCQNALFLDGDLSAIWVAPKGKRETPIVSPYRELAPGIPAGNNFGAVLVVTEKDDLEAP